MRKSLALVIIGIAVFIFGFSVIATPAQAAAITRLTKVGSINISAIDIASSGDYLYVTYNDQLRVYNISNTARPILAGSVSCSRCKYLTVSGEYAYITTSAALSALQIFNISNPAAPTLTGQVSLWGNNRSRVAISGDYGYYTASSTLYSISLLDKANPTVIGSYVMQAAVHTVVVNDSYAFVADAKTPYHVGRLYILNISDPTNISLVAHYQSVSISSDLAIKGNRLYLANGRYGADVINISNLSTPTRTRRFTPANGIYKLMVTNDSLIYSSYHPLFGYLRVASLVTPGIPRTIFSVPMFESNKFNVSPDGEYLFNTHSKVDIYQIK